MQNNNNDLIVIQNPSEAEKIPHYRQTIPVNISHFYIVDEISADPIKYLDLINTLKTAEQHDTIFIYLNTPGGAITTTIQIISAIRQCRGTVITSLEGEVCSAGTLIFLSGDQFCINPNCTFMIHCYSQWTGGKGNEVVSRVKYYEQYFAKLAHEIYGNFLTDEEIEKMLSGQDYWMDSDEVARRLGVEIDNAIAEIKESRVAEVASSVSTPDNSRQESLEKPKPKAKPKAKAPTKKK